MAKCRLDVFLFENGYYVSREKARIAIMEGKVFVNNIKEDKPGSMIKEDANIIIKDNDMKYVSRGGYKLEKAINVFNIKLADKICVDIGSSTGGFTDVMLQNGASKIFAVDCGTNQLDYKIRINKKVVVMENTNARYLTKEMLKNTDIDFVSVDVSFISLEKILPAIKNILKSDGESVMLVKPQFEAGRELVEKNGVVKSKETHELVLEKVISDCKNAGFYIYGIDYSPIKGPAGNIEYLLYVGFDENKNIKYNVKDIVDVSHNNL